MTFIGVADAQLEPQPSEIVRHHIVMLITLKSVALELQHVRFCTHTGPICKSTATLAQGHFKIQSIRYKLKPIEQKARKRQSQMLFVNKIVLYM